MAITFVLSDESINSYGARVLTAGIDLSLFQKNPIMLWMHNRSFWGKKDETLPIGRWDNIRKEDGKLLADAVFDENDEFARSIKSKVEQKILNMASIGINVIATSEEKNVIEQGQSRPTIIKSLITEASICDIGSNRNAFRLYDEFGRTLNLSDDGSEHLLPLLSSDDLIEIQQNQNNMALVETITERLKLNNISNEEQLIAQLQEMQTTAIEVATLREENLQFKKAEAEVLEAAAAALVDEAIKERRITASERDTYLTQARTNYAFTKLNLDKLPATIDLSQGAPGSESTTPWEARLAEIETNKKR